MKHGPALALALCLLPVAASAQTAAAPSAEQPSQGPMIIEPVHNGFLVAPEVKVTEIDRRSSTLAGGYAGFVFGDHLFVGGAGYGLAAERRGRAMAYGGLMLQWLGGGTDRFGWSAKALLGGGTSESLGTVQVVERGRSVSVPLRARQNFFVAEPGLDARLRLTSHLTLAAGAGYRFTGDARGRRDAGFTLPGSRLNGAVGSIGLQIGGGT